MWYETACSPSLILHTVGPRRTRPDVPEPIVHYEFLTTLILTGKMSAIADFCSCWQIFGYFPHWCNHRFNAREVHVWRGSTTLVRFFNFSISLFVKYQETSLCVYICMCVRERTRYACQLLFPIHT